MTVASWHVRLDSPVIATAIHAGHELRPELRRLMILDEDVRRREEDPYTGDLAAYVGSHVVVDRSRFEVDLNRDRDHAVYTDPADSWDTPVWEKPLAADIVERSRALHDEFYQQLGATLDELSDRHGGFVLYDVHSYNHRRGGPGAPPDDPAANPVVNLGTGSLPDRWRPVALTFLNALSAATPEEPVDVRENVRFKGRELARFVHHNYGEVGCALAIEFKKVFMDEWTHSLDRRRLAEFGTALAATVAPVRAAWEAS